MNNNYSHFFIFGCWNRDNCNGTKLDYRKAIANKLLLKKDYFDFGIIAGDNIYPHKSEKIKNYYESTLNYGFNLLQQLKNNTKNKKIYGVIGNHDIHSPNILQKQINRNVLTMPNNFFIDEKNNYIRIICFDTNLFDKIWNDNNIKENILFNVKNNNNENFYNVKNIKELEKKIDDIISEKFNGWTIIIGHEPIISIKTKDYGEKITNWNNYKEILEKIASIPKVIYMCADIHSFQAWNIKINNKNLPMIVVGTGGAEPDLSLNINKTYTHDGNKINLLATEYPYGYCDVSYNDKELIITYIPLNGCSNESNIEYTFEYNIKKNKLDFTKANIQKGKCDAKIIDKELCEKPDLIIGGKLYNKIYNGIYNLLYKKFNYNN